MGLFDFLFKDRPKEPTKGTSSFQMLDGYVPKFTSWGGGIYESELIRSAIWTRANHISKLDVSVIGSAKPALQNKLKHGPNQLQTWGQFLARLSVILDIHNTAFIVPVFDVYGQPSGFFTPLPAECEVTEFPANSGKLWLRYKFRHGGKDGTASIELEQCGVMVKHQYKSDFFGEDNKALYPTVDLIHMQNQGIQEGVKSSATYRFMAQLNNFSTAEDVTKERDRFERENFSREKRGRALLLFPNIFSNVKQVESKPWVVDAEQMAIIKANVFDYFGVSEDALQNKLVGDSWSAFYEGAIEPFAIQFSDVMTKAIFTFREQSEGNRIFASSNRIQYMSNQDKLNVSAQMLDRGIMSINDVRAIWNLPPVDGGDARIIRGEYQNADTRITDGGSDNGNE